MRPWKPLLAAGILVVLLTGVFSMVTVTVSEDEEPEPSVTVPVGNLGDRVTYARYNAGDIGYQETYRIGELEETTGQDLDRIQAFDLFVHRAGGEFTLLEHVRLSDRLVFKQTTVSSSGGGSTTPLAQRYEIDKVVNKSVHVTSGPSLPGLTLQGKTLFLGDEVSVYPERFGMTGGLVGVYAVHWGAESVEFHDRHVVWEDHGIGIERSPPKAVMADVAKEGSVEGEDVIGVVLKNEEDPLSRTRVTTFWYSPSVPYPVLIETQDPEAEGVVWRDDGPVYRSDLVQRTVLVDYSPGHTPIPWDEPGQPQELEVAPREGLRPADGSGARPKYPLSQALEHVEQAPTAPKWTLWRTQNPDAELVSARMTHGTHSPRAEGSMEWRFVFQGDEDGYEVRTEYHPDWPGPLVEKIGRTQVFLKDPAVSVSSLTISALIDAWSAQYPEAGAPDYLQWGLLPEDHRASKTCRAISETSTPTKVDEAEVSLLDIVRVGRSNLGPCMSDEPGVEYHVMTIDIAQPRLLSESRFEHESSRQLALPEEGPEKSPYPHSPADAYAPSGRNTVEVGPPAWDRGAVVAVPLLVVLLTAYFLPAIQFAATKGWMIVPAFSRIKKSKVLDHALRERIHTLIHERPGITPSALKKETGAGWGTIVHHLAVMEREELIASRVHGRHRRFFIADEVPLSERDSLAVLDSKRRQEIYTHIMDDPGLATGELADRIGVTPAGALKHLKLLENNGLVERRRDGRYVRCYPARDFRVYDPREAVEVV